MRKSASETIRNLELRIAHLEHQAQRLRPNLELADKILNPIMARIKRAKQLSSLLFQKKMSLKDAYFAKHYSSFESFNAIERAIKEKDYDKITKRGGYIREALDRSQEWDEITTTYPYMLSTAIIIVSDLVRRDDVWGEKGFRKFKLGWSKFKKAAEKSWVEYQQIIEGFEDLQDNQLAEGVTLHFSYLLGRVSDNIKARMDFKTGTLSINLSEMVKTSDRALRVIIEHELVHYEQHLQGQQISDQSLGIDDYWVEHSLKDTEFDPRLNDVSNAIIDLIDTGLDARDALDLLIGGGRVPNGVDSFVFDSAQKWLSTLKKYDSEKYHKAIKEMKRDFF
jgi:hypothetical protein